MEAKTAKSGEMFTSFRGQHMTETERDGRSHLMDMMLAAKQQIVLRKALNATVTKRHC